MESLADSHSQVRDASNFKMTEIVVIGFIQKVRIVQSDLQISKLINIIGNLVVGNSGCKDSQLNPCLNIARNYRVCVGHTRRYPDG
jgi:hypothetical protein